LNTGCRLYDVRASMANFKSWKEYMLFLIDRLIDENGVTGPFLDAGCGLGDVSEYFARRGWSGVAADFSEEALQTVRQRLAPFPNVRVQQTDLFHLEQTQARTVFLMDVIEHVKDDESLIKSLGGSLSSGSHLFMTVPVSPPEWRWDDDFYGHYRRYTRPQLVQLLGAGGFNVVEMWDCSFPLFWLMRRVYTRFFPQQDLGHLSPEERTRISTLQSAWSASHASTLIDWVFQKTHLAKIHYPFRKGESGCEVLLLAQKQ
jgi:SAM-dependent methyltransferase